MVILPSSSGYQRYRVQLLLLAVLLIVTAFTPGFAAQSRAPFVSCALVTSMEFDDCTALVALYNSTNGAAWTTNTDWLVTDLPCTWFGVTCLGNRLQNLNLTGNNLVGTLPAEIGNFDLAFSINLANNNLTG
ncbi:MAG: hypothetical protein H7X77_01135, partial [Anaerolineae bacterium]|nr:hypothetical protein [Anaerolineae bacterium]